MADWIELLQERYLSVDKMDAIYNDFMFINEKLLEKGYTIYELTDNTVSYSIKPIDVLEKMNAVESNIQTIDSSTDWVNPYFKVFKWLHNTYQKKDEVNRWILYLNFTYKVLNGTIKPSTYLADKYNRYIVDNQGNYILVYKEEENG